MTSEIPAEVEKSAPFSLSVRTLLKTFKGTNCMPLSPLSRLNEIDDFSHRPRLVGNRVGLKARAPGVGSFSEQVWGVSDERHQRCASGASVAAAFW